MNKKLNTFIFMVAATLLNLVILIAFIIGLTLLVGLVQRLIGGMPQALAWVSVVFVLLGSIGGTFFVYSKLIKWAVDKWGLEDKIEPIFRPRKR